MATDTVERVHVERMGVVAMDLPATETFPLFSAEGERRWVAGWDPCYVHPIEPGAGRRRHLPDHQQGRGNRDVDPDAT